MSDPDEISRRQMAAEWHVRLQSRAISNVELEQFYAWRADEANARAFGAVERVWQTAGGLSNDRDIQAAVRHIKRAPYRHWRLFWTIGLPVATAVALLIVWAVLRSVPTVYQTDVGERLVVKLDDGSRVTLDTSTKLAVRYGSRGRDLELDSGQALFEVAHDASRPFRVSSDGTTVVALGTVFAVRRSASGARVTLVRGQISVVTPTLPTRRLDQPGETLDAALKGAKINRNDPDQVTSWASGKIDLRGATLADAIIEVNRYTRRPVILDEQTQAGTRISGVFATDDPDAFAAAVTTLLPLRQQAGPGGEIHLVGRK